MMLAAERARLLREYIGIDRHTLETVPVFADWTAANLLAHIADYDVLFYFRFQKVREGKEREIDSIGDDNTPEDPLKKRNAELHTRIKDWDLERSRLHFFDARSSFLGELAKVSDEELHRTLHISWGEATLYDWTRWRWRHDEGHAEDLRRWRATLQTVNIPGAKNILLDALGAAWNDFRSTADLVPENERETRPICGVWTLKDVYGHMADWDTYFNSMARKMLGLDYRIVDWDEDGDKLNERWAQARRGQSWAQIIIDFKNAFRWLMTTLVTTDEKVFQQLANNADSPYPSLYHCAWSALEHYLDHAAIIRKELPIDVPDRLKVFEGPYT
jgi:hypothetical protein